MAVYDAMCPAGSHRTALTGNHVGSQSCLSSTLTLLHKDVDPFQAGADVSALLSAWGFWQPALDPTRRPTVAEVLLDSLDSAHSERQVSFCMLLACCMVLRLCCPHCSAEM